LNVLLIAPFRRCILQTTKNRRGVFRAVCLIGMSLRAQRIDNLPAPPAQT